MRKTTVYLPDDLKSRLEQLAQVEQRSEAKLIREALESYVGKTSSPVLPLFEAEPIEDFEAALRGFGER